MPRRLLTPGSARIVLALTIGALPSCAASSQPRETSAAAPSGDQTSPPERPGDQARPIPDVPCEGSGEKAADLDPSQVEVIDPDQPAPAFRVATVDCKQIDSRDLIGKKPFVLVFFSTWCPVCSKKMPVVQAAVEQIGGSVPVYGVVLDDDDTWERVEPFVNEHELTLPLVRATRFRAFSLGYNPFQSIPVVVVVGKNGYLVDLQIGYSPFDYNRLIGAVEVAKKIPSDLRPPARDGAEPARDGAEPARDGTEPGAAAETEPAVEPEEPRMSESAAEALGERP